MLKRNFLMMLVLLTISLIFVINTINAQEEKRAKVLYFTRSQSYEHSPVKLLPDGTTLSGSALKTYLATKNIELVETQDGRVFDSDLSRYDGFIFYSSGNLEEEKGSKNETAHALSSDGVKKFIAAVQAGKGFVGIHPTTESSCKQKTADGTDLFTAFIGARFVVHGAQQVATAYATEPIQVPWVKALHDGKDTVHEEWYTMNQYNKDIRVVLVQQTEGMKGDAYDRPPYPSTWIRKEGNGRVAYLPYGHNDSFWKDDANLKKVGDFIEWAVGRYELDTTPNLEKVTPEAEKLPPSKPKN